MNKFESNVINTIKMLSLDMINETGSGNPTLAIKCSMLFYTMLMKNFNFDRNNNDWINRDRLIINDKLLPVFYATMHLFNKSLTVDNLRDYHKIDSKTFNCEVCKNDVVSAAVGMALGERYIESLIKENDPKNNLINFRTFCICTEDDLMNGKSFEALEYLSTEKLNKLIIIVIRNNDANEKLKNYLNSFDLNNLEVKGNDMGAIADVIEEAKNSKKTSVILVNSHSKYLEDIDYKDKPLAKTKLEELRLKYKMELPFIVYEESYKEIEKSYYKRMEKILNKWNIQKEEWLDNKLAKEIKEFLEIGIKKIDFNADNLKINDNYMEELYLGNSKIFNILVGKSKFILNVSDDLNKFNIKNSGIISATNPTARNVLLENKTLTLGGIANGLAKMGFKVFVHTTLINSHILKPYIKDTVMNNLAVNYIFSSDSPLNNEQELIDEINSLRLIPNLINFRPADINEIIGIYSILSTYNKSSVTILSDNKMGSLSNTNYKYVLAGAYRVRREKGEANAIIVATGEEVSIALKVADELFPYGIDIRVVSMPSQELFNLQNERYKESLLPKDLRIFTMEFASGAMWNKYATNDEHVIGINKFGIKGTKEEKLKYYNLNLDAIKTKIIEIMKNN